MAIISATEYKTYRTISGSTYDALLAVLIGAAQAALETYCGRLFDSATYTDEAYDGTGSEYIIVKNTPVTTLTNVKTLDTAGTTTTVTSTDYRLDAASGRIYRLGALRGRFYIDAFNTFEVSPDFGVSPCWPIGFQNITVTYVGGYSSQTMPADLKLIMYQLVDQLFYDVKDGGGDPTLVSEKLGDYSYTRGVADAVLQVGNNTFRERLAPYRRALS